MKRVSCAETPFLVLLNCSTAKFDLAPSKQQESFSLTLSANFTCSSRNPGSLKDLRGKPATLLTPGLKSSLKLRHGGVSLYVSLSISLCLCLPASVSRVAVRVSPCLSRVQSERVTASVGWLLSGLCLSAGLAGCENARTPLRRASRAACWPSGLESSIGITGDGQALNRELRQW